MIRNLEEVKSNTKELLLDKFPMKEKYADEMLNVIMARVLVQMRLDVSTMTFLQLYQKYSLPLEMLEADDLTKNDVERLIEQSKFSERDEKIAELKFIEQKPLEYIADKLMIDKKTVNANIQKISFRIKRTAQQLYKNGIKNTP